MNNELLLSFQLQQCYICITYKCVSMRVHEKIPNFILVEMALPWDILPTDAQVI